MRLSQKRRDAVYGAIHRAITALRIDMRLPAEEDAMVAQVEHTIWRDVQKALGVEPGDVK